MNSNIIEKKLKNLSPDTPAQFGIMTPQHMIEHLTITIKIAYNRIKIPEFEPSEKQRFQKRALLDNTLDFPKGIVAPGMNAGELMPLRSQNLSEANKHLLTTIIDYTGFFELNPSQSTTHPRFGKLDYAEWERFHSKHIKHHFTQFNIW